MRALQIAATGMSAQQTRVEVTSNNLSNVSTTGYVARRADINLLPDSRCYPISLPSGWHSKQVLQRLRLTKKK